MLLGSGNGVVTKESQDARDALDRRMRLAAFPVPDRLARQRQLIGTKLTSGEGGSLSFKKSSHREPN